MTIISKDFRGFTLIEVIVSLVILGVLAAVSTIAIFKIVEGYQLAKDNAHLAQKAQVAMTRIAVELNYARTVEIKGGGGNTRIEYEAIYPDGTISENRIGIHQGDLKISEHRSFQHGHVLADADIVNGFNVSRPSEEDYRDYLVDIELSMEGANGIEQSFTTSIAHR